MQKTLVFILLIGFVLQLSAQETLGIGEWEDFQPYKKGTWITQSDTDIYFATALSVMRLTKDELSPTFIGKLDGLSDVGIESIAYDNANEQLIIVYTNSNIDIYTDLEVTNIPDIKNNANIVGSKRILDIHVFDENSAFLSSGFGIVELDLKTLDFGSTIFTEIQVNDMTSDGNRLFAATEEGIYTILIEENTNIADFGKWVKIGSEEGLSEDYAAEWIEVSGENVYTVINEELLVKKGNGSFEYIQDSTINAQDIAYLSKGKGNVLVGLETENPKSKAITIADDGTLKEVAKGCINYTLYGIEDEDHRFWFADRWTGFRYTTPGGGKCEENLSYNTPADEKVSDIAFKDGVLYVATGGVDTENGYKLLPDFNFSGLYQSDGNDWSIYNGNTLPIIRENKIYNMFQVETHPSKDNIYMGSYYEGLIEIDPETGDFTYYDEDNSALQGIIGDDNGRERIAGLAFDQSKNLWINNFGAPRPLVVFGDDGTWHSYSVNSSKGLAECVVDDNGYIWSIEVGGSNGVLVYNPNGSLADPNDDVQRVINSGNSELDGKVASIAVDLDGQIWVGTNKGPVIFDGGSGIFDSENRGTRRKVVQDSIVAFLLETEDIRTIAIDGANRKWFGTLNGIFVQSPSGETQIEHFTTANSPLFNNSIKELKYDGKTGKMYIGTDFGLQVYRSSTLGARNTHAAEVYAFPNPVRPEYTGDIHIKGLARDANVKITDLNGKLVYETQALGGLAQWNGRDYTGRKATTGVYLVFSTGTQSFDNPDAFVTKILIVD